MTPLPHEKSHELSAGTRRESCEKICPVSKDFGLRSPVIQNDFSRKQRIPGYEPRKMLVHPYSSVLTFLAHPPAFHVLGDSADEVFSRGAAAAARPRLHGEYDREAHLRLRDGARDARVLVHAEHLSRKVMESIKVLQHYDDGFTLIL